MAKSDLTAQRLREVLHYCPDTGVFTWLVRVAYRINVGRAAGSINAHGYTHIRLDNTVYLAHRLAWLYVFGVWPVSHIDHINGVRGDNRISNLRDVSASVNGQNRKRAQSNSSSGALGAYRFKTRWASSIYVSGKTRHIGYFSSAEEAHAAYLRAKRLLHEGCTI